MLERKPINQRRILERLYASAVAKDGDDASITQRRKVKLEEAGATDDDIFRHWLVGHRLRMMREACALRRHDGIGLRALSAIVANNGTTEGIEQFRDWNAEDGVPPEAIDMAHERGYMKFDARRSAAIAPSVDRAIW